MNLLRRSTGNGMPREERLGPPMVDLDAPRDLDEPKTMTTPFELTKEAADALREAWQNEPQKIQKIEPPINLALAARGLEQQFERLSQEREKMQIEADKLRYDLKCVAVERDALEAINVGLKSELERITAEKEMLMADNAVLQGIVAGIKSMADGFDLSTARSSLVRKAKARPKIKQSDVEKAE